ncbi:hypothetical protein ALC56_04612 [Trachymyrmex septentrionalis]|uniref:Uncharacterized protein n=1 Tax=Trachymyrmex septentrionalis TaxID=34720 RepID=A0A195FM06_9HYME|nr:hypothetical protein ALC56_04612 [Trachymyrmex septentrionalis]
MSQDVGMQADSNPPLAKSHRLCASRAPTHLTARTSHLAPRTSRLIAYRLPATVRAAQESGKGRKIARCRGDAGGNSAVAITGVSSRAINGHVAAGLTDS